MNDIKLNLTMLLRGRTMLSEQECLRKVRKPLMGKGKKADKVVVDKNGNEVWVTVKEFDPAKCDRFSISINDNEKPLTVYTRGTKPASRTMNLTKQSYDYFISKEVPEGFVAQNSKSSYKTLNEQAWLHMTATQRLEWHLNDICASMKGTLVSYNVFEN